jgi:hypothetical protein
MSEDELKKAGHEEEQDEVEAHKKAAFANEEPAAEGDDGDDVEAHVRRTS